MSSCEVYKPSYTTLKDFILKGKNKVNRKIGNNTIAIIQDNQVLIKYHASIIAVITDDTLTVNPSGWYTPTTKDRINWVLSTLEFRISQVNSEWILYKFYDWANPIGKVTGEVTYNLKSNDWIGLTSINDKKQAQELKKIKAYCKAYIESLFKGEVKSPDNGDCFYCRFTLPDSKEHIESHIEESYFVPSLLVKAINFKPVAPVSNWVIQSFWYDKTQDMTVFYDIAREQVYKSLLAYVKHCMVLDN